MTTIHVTKHVEWVYKAFHQCTHEQIYAAMIGATLIAAKNCLPSPYEIFIPILWLVSVIINYMKCYQYFIYDDSQSPFFFFWVLVLHTHTFNCSSLKVYPTIAFAVFDASRFHNMNFTFWNEVNNQCENKNYCHWSLTQFADVICSQICIGFKMIMLSRPDRKHGWKQKFYVVYFHWQLRTRSNM